MVVSSHLQEETYLNSGLGEVVERPEQQCKNQLLVRWVMPPTVNSECVPLSVSSLHSFINFLMNVNTIVDDISTYSLLSFW